MSTKHTPGPWTVEADINTYIIRGAPVIHTDEREIKFEFCDYVASTWGGQTQQNEINARLIAAAPDLLFQLLAATNYIEALGGNSQSYRAAIAKATGGAA